MKTHYIPQMSVKEAQVKDLNNPSAFPVRVVPARCGCPVDRFSHTTDPEESTCLRCIGLARQDGAFSGDTQFRDTVSAAPNTKRVHWIKDVNPSSFADESRCGYLVDKQSEIHAVHPENATCQSCRNLAEKDGKLKVMRESVPASHQCVESEDKVMTDRGYKPVKDVHSDCQYLITHKGTLVELCEDKEHLRRRIKNHVHNTVNSKEFLRVYRVESEPVTVEAQEVSKVETNLDEVL